MCKAAAPPAAGTAQQQRMRRVVRSPSQTVAPDSLAQPPGSAGRCTSVSLQHRAHRTMQPVACSRPRYCWCPVSWMVMRPRTMSMG